MKRWTLTLILALLSVSTPIFAQSSPHDHSAVGDAAGDAKAFAQLKTLAGSWSGQITTTPAVPEVNGTFVQFSLRVTSRGNALVHEMSVSGLPDHPVTMFYLDEGRMALTHYCDAGNRPRMVGKLSADEKTLEFDFVGLEGSNDHGHMHHAVITFIDHNHHTEDWTYMLPGDVATKAHFDLHRTNFENATSR